MIVLGICIWTVSLSAQPSVDRCPQGRTCLTAPEITFLLMRDARATKLTADSTEMAGKIDKYKNNETLYKANEADYKSQVSANKILANNYKTTALDFQDKYTKTNDKAKFRGKVLIGSLSLNLAFIITAFVIIKL